MKKKPLYMKTPAGTFEAPAHLRDKFRAMSDEELADVLNTGPFVDPVAFSVAFQERSFCQWKIPGGPWKVGTLAMYQAEQRGQANGN